MRGQKILVVHPYVRSTFFLRRIKNYIINNFSDEVHHFNVKPNSVSHEQCLEVISKQPDSSLIIFLGHGRTDRLLGSRTDKAISIISESARMESPEEYYNNEDFINEKNIMVFKNKKVFCLACNSNNKISDFAIQNGTITFLGFGDIPTSIGEFEDRGKSVSLDMIKLLKTEINYIVKKSIVYAIKNKYTFTQLSDIINFITNQRITNTLINKKWLKERYLLADYLYFFKKEIKVKGDKTIKLID